MNSLSIRLCAIPLVALNLHLFAQLAVAATPPSTVAAPPSAGAPPPPTAAQPAIDEAAVRSALVASGSLPRDVRRWRADLLTMYASRHWQLLWTTPAGVSGAAQRMLAILADAASFGLEPRDYAPVELASAAQHLAAAKSPSLVSRGQFDALLSTITARFVSDLHSGRVDPRELGHDLDVPHAALDVGIAVAAIAGSSDVAGVIADHEPEFSHYDLLKEALAKYRVLAADPGLTQLPAPPAHGVKAGESYLGVAALRRLLVALGDMLQDSGSDTLIDEPLAAAIRSFQERHGLSADGTVNAATYKALSTPLSTRVKQIEYSLERSRWLPPRLDSPPILVNIPQFQLFGFYTTADKEALLLKMKVIVGKTFPRNHTPVFAADMRYIIVRPYWDVPGDIVRNELIGKIRANPGWLARNGFEMVSGQGDDGAGMPATAANIAALARGALRLRQKPGDNNSLGLVKLIFPNRYNVYLHGTPAQNLFAATRRAFSHGCIRVEDPLSLAAFVLRDQPQWSRAALDAASKLDHSTRINLSKPVRVFILYATSIVTESGRVLFFDDIYGQDRKLAAALAR